MPVANQSDSVITSILFIQAVNSNQLLRLMWLICMGADQSSTALFLASFRSTRAGHPRSGSRGQ
jgi:hypothetical protein